MNTHIGKEIIRYADMIYNDEITNEYQMLLDDKCNEENIRMKKNRLCEKLAQCCEYYLKGLIIPKMSESASVSEIINSRSVGIKQFSHNIKKLLLENDYIHQNIVKQILYDLSDSTQNPEIKSIRKDLSRETMDYWSSDNPDDRLKAEEVGEFLDTKLEGIISEDNISNAYPLSRYSAFSSFEGDVEFLNCLCKSIRGNIRAVYKNSYIVNNYRIFPDIGSTITLIDDNGVRYLNVEDKGLFGDDLYNRIPERNAHTIIYIEDGKRYEKKFERELVESETTLKRNITKYSELDER